MLLGWLPRVPEQQAEVVQPFPDLVPQPQASVAHCGGCQGQQGPPGLAMPPPCPMGIMRCWASCPSVH